MLILLLRQVQERHVLIACTIFHTHKISPRELPAHLQGADSGELCAQNMGAPVGETEWHRNDTGVQQSHYMRDGSTATNFGSVLLTHTNRQPLSQENVAAMQHQDDTLLAAKLEQAQLSEEYEGGQKNADLGRTDSKRGLRGAMAPMHTGTSAAGEHACPSSPIALLAQRCCNFRGLATVCSNSPILLCAWRKACALPSNPMCLVLLSDSQ